MIDQVLSVDHTVAVFPVINVPVTRRWAVIDNTESLYDLWVFDGGTVPPATPTIATRSGWKWVAAAGAISRLPLGDSFDGNLWAGVYQPYGNVDVAGKQMYATVATYDDGEQPDLASATPTIVAAAGVIGTVIVSPQPLPVSLPHDPLPVTPSLPPNAAQETGGNLAAIEGQAAHLPTIRADADNLVTTAGFQSDAAVTTDINASAAARLRGLLKAVTDVWDGVNHRFRVDGSGVTQPVSATALPLPSNAAQETGGNLATLVTDAGTLVTQTANVARETGGHLATVDTSTAGLSTVTGATGDAAVTADNPGSISAKLRGLAKIFADVWDSTGHRLKVDASGVTVPVSVTTSPVPVSITTNPVNVSGTIGISGGSIVVSGITLAGRFVTIPVVPHLNVIASNFTGTASKKIGAVVASGLTGGQVITTYLYGFALTLRGLRYLRFDLSLAFYDGSNVLKGSSTNIFGTWEIMGGQTLVVAQLTAFQYTVPTGAVSAWAYLNFDSAQPSGGTYQLNGTLLFDCDTTGVIPPPAIGNGSAQPVGEVY